MFERIAPEKKATLEACERPGSGRPPHIVPRHATQHDLRHLPTPYRP